jgi:outer membrane protein TolC
LPFWQSQLAFRAAWELDFWGKFRRGVESADAAYLASIATYDDVLVSLLSDIATTYIGIRTLEKQKLEYRYTAAASLELSHINEVLAGVNYRFGGM